MASVVEFVSQEFADVLEWQKVVTKTKNGALRYQELSRALGRPAPVPSIFVQGQLIYDAIPDPEALKSYLSRRIEGRNHSEPIG